MSKVENKVDIQRSFGEVILKLELPSVEKLFKGLSGNVVTNVTQTLEERLWYFPKGEAPKMNFYKLEPDTIDEILESFTWTRADGARYEFNIDTNAGHLVTGNRINIAFLRLQNIGKPMTLSFKGIFNTTTLETFHDGMKAFIKSLVDFNKPLTLKFEIPEGEGNDVETVTL